jgi:hypothetical protein
MQQGHIGPYIDETVEHVGVSRLRSLNATNLRNIEKTFVIQDNDKPLAVLLSYDQFLAMQRHLVSVVNTLELVSGQNEFQKFRKGLDDINAGREKLLSEIEEECSQQK